MKNLTNTIFSEKIKSTYHNTKIKINDLNSYLKKHIIKIIYT